MNNNSYLLKCNSEDKSKDIRRKLLIFKFFNRERCILKSFTKSDYSVGFCENVQKIVKKCMNLHQFRQICMHQVYLLFSCKSSPKFVSGF